MNKTLKQILTNSTARDTSKVEDIAFSTSSFDPWATQ